MVRQEIRHPTDVAGRALGGVLGVQTTKEKEMNPELDFQLMKSQAGELRRAAAEHRKVREAERRNKSERRSVFGKRRAS